MSRFRQIKYPKDNPELENLYKMIIKDGFVGPKKDVPMNFITSLSGRPDILAATWALAKGILFQGMLPPTVKQMIIVVISISNNCRYCTVAHTAALEALGVPNEIIDSFTTNFNLAEVTPPQRAILEFALKTAKNPQSVTDENFQTLRDYGLDDGEIMEIIMTAAFSNFINTWAEVSGISIDGEE